VEQSISYTYPGTVESIRVTVGTVNVIAYGRYEQMRWEAAEWFAAETGEQPGALAEDAVTPELAEPLRYLDVALHRAYMLAAVLRVEWQTEAEGVWVADKLPAIWDGIPGFATQVPAPLYLAWRAAARACNPGVWWVDSTDAGKADGGVSVTTSMTSSRL
jgi:hypothetical protein